MFETVITVEGRQPGGYVTFQNGTGPDVATDVGGNPVADRPAVGFTRASVRLQGRRYRAKNNGSLMPSE
jgi:hypothetical protein